MNTVDLILIQGMNTVDSLKLLSNLLKVMKGFLPTTILQGQRTQQLRFNN